MGDPYEAEIIGAALAVEAAQDATLARMTVDAWVGLVRGLLRIIARLMTGTTEAREAQNWRMLRDEVQRLDQIARPGPTQMGDDDLLQVVLRVMRAAAKETKGLEQ